MSVLDDPNAYKKNPLYPFHEKSDYSFFYITLTTCTIFILVLLVLNIYLCCFSKHKHYWNDSNTGNRWLFPLWIKSPAGQTPLDLKELEYVITIPTRSLYDAQFPEEPCYHEEEYLELKRKESDI